LPAGGISEDAAQQSAKDYVPAGATFVSALAGPFAVVAAPAGNDRLGPGFPVKATDLVWQLTYREQIEICTPNGPCLAPRAATYTVQIDYMTGAFR